MEFCDKWYNFQKFVKEHENRSTEHIKKTIEIYELTLLCEFSIFNEWGHVQLQNYFVYFWYFLFCYFYST